MQKNPPGGRHAAYRIVPCNERFLVFDKQGKHRCNFATQALAEAWIEAKQQRRHPRRSVAFHPDPDDLLGPCAA